LDIGQLINQKGYSTAVAKNQFCASACALIWLAGKNRIIDKKAALGFHASYIERNGQKLESGVANALIGSYLTHLNLNENAIIFVTSAPPEGMNWLTPDNSKKWDIESVFFDENNYSSDKPVIQKLNEVDAYDPYTTVSLFYSYLSHADGNNAAALVIPEKRGIGPFNESNISNFFGQMLEPLSILEIRRIDTDNLIVKYQYKKLNGKYCLTDAQVKTTYRYGRTLIERINAKC
jgi:hypothetical protein